VTGFGGQWKDRASRTAGASSVHDYIVHVCSRIDVAASMTVMMSGANPAAV
jgi:hypothetical protein